MNQDKLISNIKKLFALAGNNPNQYEAEVAMKRAHKLLNENNLSMIDLADIDAEEIGSSVFGNVVGWNKHLYNAVSSLYMCKYFTSNKLGHPMHVIVGAESNRVTASIVIESLLSVIKEQSKGKGVAYRNGMMFGVIEKCNELMSEDERELSTGTGLVLADIKNARMSANEEYISQYTELSKGRSSSYRTNAEGQAAGRKLSVNARMSNKLALN